MAEPKTACSMDDLEPVNMNGDWYIVPRTMGRAFATRMSIKDDQNFPRAMGRRP